ncbi:hypothetical protein Raf01_93650 [Rugosimonospora africana]|uniref:Uncharacterized protein n=1 Tax=Rugosimonospora africana TaxID=556532 RepID=A0A8J3VWV5_9ACTN|nr:hypothetical protein Raf01_93650 [Rugosimonospora africana]
MLGLLRRRIAERRSGRDNPCEVALCSRSTQLARLYISFSKRDIGYIPRARGGTSSLDFAGGKTAANMAITPVGANGSIDLYNGGGATVDLLVDLYGAYYKYPSSQPL